MTSVFSCSCIIDNLRSMHYLIINIGLWQSVHYFPYNIIVYKVDFSHNTPSVAKLQWELLVQELAVQCNDLLGRTAEQSIPVYSSVAPYMTNIVAPWNLRIRESEGGPHVILLPWVLARHCGCYGNILVTVV